MRLNLPNLPTANLTKVQACYSAAFDHLRTVTPIIQELQGEHQAQIEESLRKAKNICIKCIESVGVFELQPELLAYGDATVGDGSAAPAKLPDTLDAKRHLLIAAHLSLASGAMLQAEAENRKKGGVRMPAQQTQFYNQITRMRSHLDSQACQTMRGGDFEPGFIYYGAFENRSCQFAQLEKLTQDFGRAKQPALDIS